MHYYKFNIADWALHTAHLTLVEEAVYFRLINHYYDTEQPIQLETQPVIRRLRMGNELVIAESILCEFFVKTEKGFIHNRCEALLKEYRKTTKKNRANGALGGRPKKAGVSSETQPKPSGLIVGTQEEPKHNPNQELLTTNHKPLTKENKPTPVKPKYEDCDLEFANQAFEEILKVSPDYKKPNLETWAKDVRLMREVDGKDLSEMATVWIWVRQDRFWSTNVLSISKFRDKYEQLKMKMNEVNGNETNQRSNTARPDKSASGRIRANAEKRRREIQTKIDEISGDDRPLADDGRLIRQQVRQ